MGKYQLLVGSEAFWGKAAEDIGRARSRLYVQAMTFEADRAGAAVGAAIARSPASDRRVLVDHYTRYVISDRFVFSPAYLVDKAFRDEVRATHAMFRQLSRDGVGVRATNPAGALLSGFAFRNHKKLIVADDVVYVGGINFSDHNFKWHDLMLRVEDAAAAERLARDFEDTFAGKSQAWSAEFGDLRLFSLDGRDNPSGFQALIGLIEAAESEIVVVSPYLTFPFVPALARAAARGVAVRLITPLDNNKRLVRDYLLTAARAAGFDLRITPGMSHLKAMLIDGRALVLGSSNFDFVSYHAEEELVAVASDPGLIEDFRRGVVEPALEAALSPETHVPSVGRGRLSEASLKFAEWFVSWSPRARCRATPWTS